MTTSGALPDARTLAERVAGYAPSVRPEAWASTALILSDDGTAGPHILFIKRPSRPGDRWSGDMALPGGKHEPDDAGPAVTAMRETAEEVAVILDHPLARLDDQVGRPSSHRVATFVFVVDGLPEPVPEPSEVAEAVWLPLGALADPASKAWFRYRGVVPFPAIEVNGYTIWGLTHRMVTHFLSVAGVS